MLSGPPHPLLVCHHRIPPSGPVAPRAGGTTWASATNGSAFIACAVHCLATFECCCCPCRVPEVHFTGVVWGRGARLENWNNQQRSEWHDYQDDMESTLKCNQTPIYINIYQHWTKGMMFFLGNPAVGMSFWALGERNRLTYGFAEALEVTSWYACLIRKESISSQYVILSHWLEG